MIVMFDLPVGSAHPLLLITVGVRQPEQADLVSA